MRSTNRSLQLEPGARVALRPPASTARWYEAHVRRFGYGYKALGFGRRSSQEKRFEALLSLGAFHGRRLLDAGCAFGDLLAYLTGPRLPPAYTHFPISPP